MMKYMSEANSPYLMTNSSLGTRITYSFEVIVDIAPRLREILDQLFLLYTFLMVPLEVKIVRNSLLQIWIYGVELDPLQY